MNTHMDTNEENASGVSSLIIEIIGAGNGDRTRDPRLGNTKKAIFLTP